MIERVFIEESMKRIRLERYLKSELSRAGFTKMEMSRTPLVTRIVVSVTKPGLAIGKSGQNIRALTKNIADKFGIENPQIEIDEISVPELNATAMVDRMVELLERGYSWRSVAFKTVENIMKANAQGVELVLKGKLAGKGGRKAKQRIAKGYMKKAGGLTSLVDYAKADAYPKAGAIGVKLRVIKPDIIFPDKSRVEELLKAEAEEEEVKAAEEKEEKGEEKKEVKEEKGEKAEKIEEKKVEKKVEKEKVKKKEKEKAEKKVEKEKAKKKTAKTGKKKPSAKGKKGEKK